MGEILRNGMGSEVRGMRKNQKHTLSCRQARPGMGCGVWGKKFMATGDGRRAKPAKSKNILMFGPVWGVGKKV
jgi:hypothetical protein